MCGQCRTTELTLSGVSIRRSGRLTLVSRLGRSGAKSVSTRAGRPDPAPRSHSYRPGLRGDICQIGPSRDIRGHPRCRDGQRIGKSPDTSRILQSASIGEAADGQVDLRGAYCNREQLQEAVKLRIGDGRLGREEIVLARPVWVYDRVGYAD